VEQVSELFGPVLRKNMCAVGFPSPEPELLFPAGCCAFEEKQA